MLSILFFVIGFALLLDALDSQNSLYIIDYQEYIEELALGSILVLIGLIILN